MNESSNVQVLNTLFPQYVETAMICELCEGSHGWNYLCQMPTEGDDHEVC